MIHENPLATRAVNAITSIKNREARATLIGAVKAFSALPSPITALQMQQLWTFEQQFHGVLQADKRWFFANQNDPEASQFARDLQLLHSVGANCIEGLIERRAEWSSAEIEPSVARAIAFALYHFSVAIKWSFYRAEVVKPNTWTSLHRLYKLAEECGIARSPVSLFDDPSPSAQTQSTIEALYLRALLLDRLNTGSLTLPQIEIASSWLAEWTHEFGLAKEYDQSRHVLYVDLNEMQGLKLIKAETFRPSARFVELDALPAQLDAVRASLRAGQPFLGQGAPLQFPIEEHVALLASLEKLQTILTQASTAKIEERHSIENVSADVYLGFAQATRIIAGVIPTAAEAPIKFGGFTLTLEGDTSTSASVGIAPLRWRIKDQSAKGYGLLIGRSDADRLPIAQLLAIKPPGSTRWSLGVVVRKLPLESADEFLIGVELLSAYPLPLKLSPASNSESMFDEEIVAPIDAVYLPGIDADGKSDLLILPSSNFELKNLFDVTVDDTSYVLRVNRVIRKGEDWIALRFEVVAVS